MPFSYFWSHHEANFGKPLKRQISGGMHVSFEIILKYQGKYIGLRRPSIPGHEAPLKKRPKEFLYFCHDLIRYGESVEKCVKRIVKSQTGVDIKSYRVVDIDSTVQAKDGQWAFTPHVIAELETKPIAGRHGNVIAEVVAFTKRNVPDEFAWWTKDELENFLKKLD